MERSTSLKNSIGMLGDLMMLLGVIFIFLGFLCRRYRNIHAKYKDGILKLSVPKKAPEKIEKDGYIAIEG